MSFLVKEVVVRGLWGVIAVLTMNPPPLFLFAPLGPWTKGGSGSGKGGA